MSIAAPAAQTTLLLRLLGRIFQDSERTGEPDLFLCSCGLAVAVHLGLIATVSSLGVIGVVHLGPIAIAHSLILVGHHGPI